MVQDFTNPFKNLARKPYCLIAAGQGPSHAKMPDGTTVSASEVKRQLGYPQLCAWNLEPKQLLDWVDYLNKNPESTCKLVVDSGAYSMWSRGKEFDIDEYIEFLNSNNVIETAFWVAEADVIPGSMNVDPTEEERIAAPEKSWENYLYMIDRVKMPKKVVPIFHQGEDFKHLIRMLNYKFADGDYIPYIGISPRNDVHVNEKAKWYELTWKLINEECAKLQRQIPLTHNFGMTTISLMEQYPSFSSDSTSWLRSAGFGKILLVINGSVKHIRVSDQNLDSPDHINNQSPAVREAVEKLCEKIGHGITLQYLIESNSSPAPRMIFNLYSLNEWRINFEYKGNSFFKKSLW